MYCACVCKLYIMYIATRKLCNCQTPFKMQHKTRILSNRNLFLHPWQLCEATLTISVWATPDLKSKPRISATLQHNKTARNCYNLAGLLLQRKGRNITCSRHNKAPPKCCIPPALLPPLGQLLNVHLIVFVVKGLSDPSLYPFQNAPQTAAPPTGSACVCVSITRGVRPGRTGLVRKERPVLVMCSMTWDRKQKQRHNLTFPV